ncbi:MAG TPA: ImmA/IrrE family metallo-endopeptidase [Azospirillaceae bacterium]|nr:ImmA/IrrE family metallo-endopeptidase [Azospirillaceae bacterium]
MQFNPERLELALRRRRLTAATLADRIGFTSVSLSRIRNLRQVPPRETVERIAEALSYPIEFFYGDCIDSVDENSVSFRSLSSVTLREKHAAIAAGCLAYSVADWLKSQYNLPNADLIDCSQERDPAAAARSLRQHWSLGEQPIGNMIKLLESRGIRVFSLAENTKNVDAFSCWRNEEPYIFLNTFKSTERSRFDAAHELGHLVLHKHGGSNQGQQAEDEANSFASSFLMPKADVLSQMPRVHTLNQIIASKKRWGVSAAALIYRLHKIGVISDWQNRTFNIQLRTNYGSTEPDSLPREISVIWKMVLDDLWKHGIPRNKIADELRLPQEELENLLFGLTSGPDLHRPAVGKPSLSVIEEK